MIQGIWGVFNLVLSILLQLKFTETAFTLNLTPSTINNEASTIKALHLTFNLQPSTINLTPYTLKHLPYLCQMLIKSAKYIISSPDFEKCPAPDKKEYAFIGRSNVGKSSLINMLSNNDKLAKTSGTPGKTQLINHFEITSASAINTSKEGQNVKWYLVDLPGYGFAKVSIRSRRRWEQMIEGYLRKRVNLEMVFVLIDARHSPQKLDLDFLNQLDKWEIPFAMIFTKADKETQAVVAKNVKLFLERLRKTWQFLPQHFVSSATKKLGRDKILALIDEKNEVKKGE